MITTLLATFVILLLCAAALGIGYLLTGKSKLKKGCGKTPDDKPPRGGCGSGGCGGCR